MIHADDPFRRRPGKSAAKQGDGTGAFGWLNKLTKVLLDIFSQRKSGKPSDGEGNPFPRWRRLASIIMNMPVIWELSD
jgi:hypothetical protein